MKRGFTLIELLVVIAIIGILASVVLASLNTARSEGEDARDIANLNNARSQAELFYSTTGNSSYDATTAPNDNTGNNVCSDGTNNISALLPTGSTCVDSPSAWAASTPVDGGVYCVDSTGFGGEIATASFTALSEAATEGASNLTCN